MKRRNVFYLVETIQPWVGTDKFAQMPREVTTRHKLFRDDDAAWEAFHNDVKRWKEWGAREFYTFTYTDDYEGLMQMRQFVITIDGKEFVGYTKIMELKARG